MKSALEGSSRQNIKISFAVGSDGPVDLSPLIRGVKVVSFLNLDIFCIYQVSKLQIWQKTTQLFERNQDWFFDIFWENIKFCFGGGGSF